MTAIEPGDEITYGKSVLYSDDHADFSRLQIRVRGGGTQDPLFVRFGRLQKVFKLKAVAHCTSDHCIVSTAFIPTHGPLPVICHCSELDGQKMSLNIPKDAQRSHNSSLPDTATNSARLLVLRQGQTCQK